MGNNATPLSQMKDALNKALQSRVRQSQELPLIVITPKSLELIASLIKKGDFYGV